MNAAMNILIAGTSRVRPAYLRRPSADDTHSPPAKKRCTGARKGSEAEANASAASAKDYEGPVGAGSLSSDPSPHKRETFVALTDIIIIKE